MPVIENTETLKGNGFTGQFDRPAGALMRPAVMLIGGSEGGVSSPLLQAVIAAHGYPTLAIAYFGLPGLPLALFNIPLEYFARAASLLAGQPSVDPKQIVSIGISRGSEAALLLGVHYPNLVSGVVASVPRDAAICSFPDCNGPAWTLGGKALPYTREFDNPKPVDNPSAIIPVELIHGPIFLDCGGSDSVWTSCPYADAIVARLDEYHDAYPHPLFAYGNAGHGVGDFVPYEPGIPAVALAGDTATANELAREQLWPHLLAFLDEVSMNP